jgi:hypothetical protein
MVPGTPTIPLIHAHLLLELPQPLTACVQMLYPDDPASAPNCAYTELPVVEKGPAAKGPPMLLLKSTTEELVPVFHEYVIPGPPVVLAVTRYTSPLHAPLAGPLTDAMVVEGGAVLTSIEAEPEPASLQ